MPFSSWSAQRTAVKQRPHQETEALQVATSEPVVLHHGREGGGAGHDEVRPSASTACWAAAVSDVRDAVGRVLHHQGSGAFATVRVSVGYVVNLHRTCDGHEARDWPSRD